MDRPASNPAVLSPETPSFCSLLVSNLLENALKYSPKEGAITLTLAKEGRHTLLAVKDKGPGCLR
jgi:two-component system sensor histidine kinase CiaH